MLIPLIEEHYRANRQRLVKRLSFRAGSHEDGEDIVQEAYYRALKYQKSFDGSNFDRWFNTILVNTLREHKNAMKGYSTAEYDENEEEAAPCVLMPRRIMLEVFASIKQRPAAQQEILMLFFEQEYTAKDISKILPYSYAQVHQTIQRFRNELKEVYKE